MIPIAERVWDRKYRLRSADGAAVDATLADTIMRVARAAAGNERGGKRVRERWAQRFADAMGDLGFIPAGRILAGAGSGRAVTLFNCFVMGAIEDDLGSIFDHVKEAALTMQQGGGIGHDFSTLRPKGALVRSIGADASGPVSFMDVWDAMCRTIMSAGARRGAMMATLRCDHPDIEDFIAAKRDPHRLRNFNLSVLVTDAFMDAVRHDRIWELHFAGKVYRTLRAAELWEQLMRATYDYAEPGVIFIDRVNARNNLAYCERIAATNPCGEQPLPPYGACLLGSVNLEALVERPFAPDAGIDTSKLEERVATAVRLLDNVIDISGYPLEAQHQEARSKRRIGLGITGLADALIYCGAHYGSEQAQHLASSWMAGIQRAAYLASTELAREKGAFPLFEAEPFLASPNLASHGQDVRTAVARHGIRNGCLTSIAPTGTISLLAGNVSSGIEPVFDYSYRRRMLDREGTTQELAVEDAAYVRFRSLHGPDAPLPAAFVRAGEITPRQHLQMQAALQAYVDSSISKTINCPADLSFADFKDVYLDAHGLGLKGCTTYRPNPITGEILKPAPVTGAMVATTAEAGPLPAQPEAALQSIAHKAHARILAERADQPRLPPSQRDAAAPPVERGAGVVYMAKPLERDAALAGYTYKLKWPGSDHAIYVTINDIEREGRRRPFEIFINTKNLEHYAWTVALTRMISAVFRRGGDVSFVVEELKAVFDPQGGRWMDGRYVPSLLAAIGQVIEAHMIRTGFMQRETGNMREEASQARSGRMTGRSPQEAIAAVPRRFCPRCSSSEYERQDGCWVCRDCGHSHCD